MCDCRYRARGVHSASCPEWYTPTDDEREALLDSERLRQLAEWMAMEQGHEETAKRVNSIADRLDRLAGFRHTEVPEPSATCPKCGVTVTDQTPSTFYAHHDEKCGGSLDEPQGEASDAPTVRLMARKGGKRQALIDSILEQGNDRGIRVEIVDQTIPLYAMLDVWMALYSHDNSQAFDGFYESAGYAEAWATLLAAIRARAGEPQGEPSDDYEAGYAEGFHHGVSSPRGSAQDERLDYYDPARQDRISEHDCVFEDGEWWFGHGMPCKYPKLHEARQGELTQEQMLQQLGIDYKNGTTDDGHPAWHILSQHIEKEES